MEDERLVTFLEWCRGVGIFIDPRLEIRRLPSGPADREEAASSLAVFSKSFINRDQIVCKVPKGAILSARTSRLFNLCPRERYESSSALSLELALCLLYEKLRGPASNFSPYLEILPGRGLDLPIFWYDEEEGRVEGSGDDGGRRDAKFWLKGTEVERVIRRSKHEQQGSAPSSRSPPSKATNHHPMTRQRLIEYFRTIGENMLRRSGLDLEDLNKRHEELDGVNLEKLFQRCYSIVSSRAFVVDVYHGLALVPVADLFNHSSHHNIHFESDDVVCPECGSFDACHRHGFTNPLLPPTRRSKAGRGRGLEEEEEDDEDEWIDSVDMRVVRTVYPSDELLNTYGQLSNTSLMIEYGFCLDEDTDQERLTWDPRYPQELGEILDCLFGGEEEEEEEEGEEKISGTGEGDPSLGPCSKRGEEWDRLMDSIFQLAHLGEGRERGEEAGRRMRRLWSSLDSIFTRLEEGGEGKVGATTATLHPVEEPFTPLSDHEGSQDLELGLFVDQEGRVSLPLWRLFLLSSCLDHLGEDGHRVGRRGPTLEALVSSCQNLLSEVWLRFQRDPDEEDEVTQGRGEAALNAKRSHQDGTASGGNPILPSTAQLTTRDALIKLCSLFRRRISSMNAHRHERGALQLLALHPSSSSSTPITLHSISKAYQEMASLRVSVANLSLLSRKLLPPRTAERSRKRSTSEDVRRSPCAPPSRRTKTLSPQKITLDDGEAEDG
ncbi:SET domain-containing protein [Violaceomyces palustris]|uniref:SET domain-containing protein n=1 Tax=Violaceomyces palustris TaxID=1673888 RepID=A0ACD0NU87_9BASI|nr:SET domain-containing protein [Violaceomyces palustris]